MRIHASTVHHLIFYRLLIHKCSNGPDILALLAPGSVGPFHEQDSFANTGHRSSLFKPAPVPTGYAYV